MKRSDCDFGSAEQRAMGSLHSFAYSEVKRLMAFSLGEAMRLQLRYQQFRGQCCSDNGISFAVPLEVGELRALSRSRPPIPFSPLIFDFGGVTKESKK